MARSRYPAKTQPIDGAPLESKDLISHLGPLATRSYVASGSDLPATAPCDLQKLPKERVASRCICCGSANLSSSPAILMPFVADRIFGWKPVTIDASWGLRTVPSGQALSICKTLLCNACGHLFCDIRFSSEEMAGLYHKYREAEYTALREHYEPGYAVRNAALNEPVCYLDQVEAFLGPHLEQPFAILDWGGDTGVNTPFRRMGAEVDVYDISEKVAEPGVRMVSLGEATSRKYGLVVCSMVLEHVPYPSEILLDVRQAMTAGAILYLEVPFEEIMWDAGPRAPSDKRHWHEHINFYSQGSIRALLENCGLTIIQDGILKTVVAGSNVHVMQVACRLADV